jgi:hypothetical protein
MHPQFENRDIATVWEEEVERRIEEIEQGRSKLVPLDESLSKARDAISRLFR